jgi:ribosomal protein S1
VYRTRYRGNNKARIRAEWTHLWSCEGLLFGRARGFGMWDEAKKRFPVGARVHGIVTHHCPFGIFVDLGDPVAKGLVEIPSFLDEGRMTPEQYPPVGAAIEAVVIGHMDHDPQIWLSMRPSELRKQH